jgi:hypothetical protein
MEREPVDPTSAIRQRRWRQQHATENSEYAKLVAHLRRLGIKAAAARKVIEKPSKAKQKIVYTDETIAWKKEKPDAIAAVLISSMGGEKARTVFEVGLRRLDKKSKKAAPQEAL